MSPEQKAKIDTLPESELWQALSTTPAADPQALYIRERLTQKSQGAANQKLDEISRRLLELEYASHRSSLGTPTFWLALLAVIFSSFAVPWETVEEKFETWRQKAATEWQRPTPRPRATPQTRGEAADPSRPAHEPALPQNPSATPASPSPLFPQ